MKRFSLVAFLTLMLSVFSNNSKAQEDCCGVGSIFSMLVQSGIQGGYGLQQYSAAGWNHYVDVYNEKRTETLTKKMDNFGTAMGFKIGANIIRIQQEDILFDVKLAYSWMKEINEATADLPTGGSAKREYELKLGTFGFGFGISYVLNRHFDIKILDAMVTWTSTDLINKYTDVSSSTEQKLSSPESSVGGSIATGLVFYPLPPYVSIEANVGYSLFSIDEMRFDDQSSLQVDENTSELMTNFIDGGGLFAFIQLNVAVPF